jgi:hypothetical protein
MGDDPQPDTSAADNAAAFRRAGLTEREARRLSGAEALREETQSIWEASPLGILAWLVWRALYKGFQPVWFLVSLALSVWFGLQILAQSGGLNGLTSPEPSVEARLRVAIAAAVPEDVDARDFWTEQMETALAGDRRRRADIETFRAWAYLGPDLIGRERLALEYMADGQPVPALEAELRAGAPWERQSRIDGAYHEQIEMAEHQGLDPAELVFAPDRTVRRYNNAIFNWSIAEAGARDFFIDSAVGQFELTSLPGLVVSRRESARLFGGVRHLVIQACAHAQTRRQPLDGCEDGIIPRHRLDRVQFGLAALETGLVDLDLARSIVKDGAEVLMAASRAGRLTPELETSLDAWLSSSLPSDTILDALRETGMRQDLSFAAPRRAERQLEGLLPRPVAVEAAELTRLLEGIGRLRRASSPTIAVRLMSGIRGVEDADRMVRLAATAGDRLLAMHLLMGEDMYVVLEDLPPPPEPEPRLFHGLIAGLVSALMVLMLTISRLMTPVFIRRAGRLNAIDARLCRSFLGSKA